MEKCGHCKKKCLITFECICSNESSTCSNESSNDPRTKNRYCIKHLQPEIHNCKSIDEIKLNKRKMISNRLEQEKCVRPKIDVI
jgi:hypothetical protein